MTLKSCAEQPVSSFENRPDIVTPWEWIPFMKAGARLNMDLDREIFKAMPQENSRPALRFYQWEHPAVSYGRTQGIDAQTLKEATDQGWETAQRPTGGGIVRHGSDLCFSICWRKDTPGIPWKVSDSYLFIHRWIQQSLTALGFSTELIGRKTGQDGGWCFQNAVCFDLIMGGRKIVGGAQWRGRTAALHQGSIQIEILPQKIEAFKKEFEGAFAARLAE